MDTIRLRADGTLSSDAPFAGLLRMKLEIDEDATLRSFFRLLRRCPLAREVAPGLAEALEEAEACPPAGCRYPGLEALRLAKRVELSGFPGAPRVDVYLAVEGVGDDLPELRFFPPAGHARHAPADGAGAACPARRGCKRAGRRNVVHAV